MADVEGTLRDRVRYFLKSPIRGRPEVTTTLSRLSTHGEVLIFGGMLRDLLLRGNAGFDSDIDVVLVDADRARVARTLASFDVRQNRFGGYRLARRNWKLDVWHLEDTWAFHSGLVTPATPEGLVRTTFFTWDAAVFSLTSGHLWTHPQFSDHVMSRVLDVNLLPNPSPDGVVVRALRSTVRLHARMTRPIAEYVLDVLEQYSAANLIDRERMSYHHSFLTEALIHDVRRHLTSYLQLSAAYQVPAPLYQYALDLPGE